jgi:DNA-binding HxlR family transcriptional regulator
MGHRESGNIVSIDHDFIEGARAVRRLLRLKWSPDIMIALGDGRKRYNEIMESINHRHYDGRDCLQAKVLAETLRDMEANGLIRRFERPGAFPPVVEYELTPEAHELMAAMASAAYCAARAFAE